MFILRTVQTCIYWGKIKASLILRSKCTARPAGMGASLTLGIGLESERAGDPNERAREHEIRALYEGGAERPTPTTSHILMPLRLPPSSLPRESS